MLTSVRFLALPISISLAALPHIATVSSFAAIAQTQNETVNEEPVVMGVDAGRFYGPPIRTERESSEANSVSKLPPLDVNGLRQTSRQSRMTDRTGSNSEAPINSEQTQTQQGYATSNPSWGQQPDLPQALQRSRPFEVPPISQLPPVANSPSSHGGQLPSSRTIDSYGDTAQFPPTEAGNIEATDIGIGRTARLQPSTAAPIKSALLPDQLERGVTAATYDQAMGTSNRLDLSVAKDLISRYDISKAPGELPGVPMPLLEVLGRTPIHQRRAMVHQYWETYYDWARLLNAAQYVNWLAQVATPGTNHERLMLNAARSAADNALLAAEIQLGKSQSKLQEFILSGQNDLLPLPSDQPLIQKYKTHYDWYASRQLLPTKLKGIDQMLPKCLQLIANRASTVRSSQSVLNQLNTAYGGRQIPFSSVLEAARIWQDAEINLLASITSYNQAIADYSLTVKPSHTAPEQIVAMLIAKPMATQLNTASRSNDSRVTGRRHAQHNEPRGGNSISLSDSNSLSQFPGRTQGRPTDVTPQNRKLLDQSSFGQSSFGQSPLGQRTNTPQNQAPQNKGGLGALPDLPRSFRSQTQEANRGGYQPAKSANQKSSDQFSPYGSR